MSKVDMNYIDYLYTKSGILGQNTRKSPAGDLFREVATALDVNTTLLKEGHDPNRRYCFEEEHASLILEMLEVAKSWEGKRLRCRDYSGCRVETKNISFPLSLHFSKITVPQRTTKPTLSSESSHRRTSLPRSLRSIPPS